MAKYEADIYYSGFITVPVEADNEEQALEIAREEAARYHNKRQAEFTEELLGNVDVWREADTVREIHQLLKA